MVKVICSRCKCESEPIGKNQTPKEWCVLTFNTVSRTYITYPLCPKCKAFLGIKDSCHTEDVGERLIEILEEIVTNTQE